MTALAKPSESQTFFLPEDRVVATSPLLADLHGRVIGMDGLRVLVVFEYPLGMSGPQPVVASMDPADLRKE